MLTESHKILVPLAFASSPSPGYTVIYLAKLSGKIPIVSPLSAHTAHLHDNAASEMHPSRIFDFDGLFAELDMPWVDLDALRPRIEAPTVVLGSPADQPPSREKEVLPTWGLLETTFYRCGMGYGAEIWGSREIGACRPLFALRLVLKQCLLPLLLDLEQVKTPLPYELFSANSENQAGVFERLARFLRNPAIAASWANPPAPRVQVQLDHYSEVHPDFKCEAPAITPNPWTDALTTIDGMYWLISEEMGPDYPMRDVQDQFRHGHANWQQVGKHMRFLPQWEDAARAAERKLLGLTEDEEVPKVSVRRRSSRCWTVASRVLTSFSSRQFHALHIRRGGELSRCSRRRSPAADLFPFSGLPCDRQDPSRLLGPRSRQDAPRVPAADDVYRKAARLPRGRTQGWQDWIRRAGANPRDER